MKPRDLPQAWREQAELQRSFGAAEAACTLEHCAKELEASFKSYANEKLTVAEAAQTSGYSEDSLRNLLRKGTIPNAGIMNAPRIRRLHQPLKPGHFADGPGIRPALNLMKDTAHLNKGIPRRGNEYDPEEDARDIAKLMEAKS